MHRELKAQGCEERATLGTSPQFVSTPTETSAKVYCSDLSWRLFNAEAQRTQRFAEVRREKIIDLCVSLRSLRLCVKDRLAILRGLTFAEISHGVVAFNTSANRPQPRWGCRRMARLPMVASQTRQPWALSHNPVGIGRKMWVMARLESHGYYQSSLREQTD